MEAWVTFWKIVLIVVFSLFYAVVLFVIPFGLRDIFILFRKLRDQAKASKTA